MLANTYDGQRMTTQRRTAGFPLLVYPWSSLTGRDACKRCVLLVWFGMDWMWWTFMALHSSPSSVLPRFTIVQLRLKDESWVQRCYITFNLTPHDSFFFSHSLELISNIVVVSFFRHPLSTSHISSLTAFWLKDFLCSLKVKIRGALPVSWDCSRGEDTKFIFGPKAREFLWILCVWELFAEWLAVVLNRETKRKIPLLNTKLKGYVKKCQKEE